MNMTQWSDFLHHCSVLKYLIIILFLACSLFCPCATTKSYTYKGNVVCNWTRNKIFYQLFQTGKYCTFYSDELCILIFVFISQIPVPMFLYVFRAPQIWYKKGVPVPWSFQWICPDYSSQSQFSTAA